MSGEMCGLPPSAECVASMDYSDRKVTKRWLRRFYADVTGHRALRQRQQRLIRHKTCRRFDRRYR